MKEGDFIVGIGDNDVKWSPHEEVVTFIKAAGNNLNLKIVTPVEKKLKPVRVSIILCSIDLDDGDARSTPLSEFR